MIEVRGLSKRFGSKVAVDDLTFEVRPGVVTGFLGPNGSGKSTTMRMIMGLDRPTAGQALVNGRPYAELRWPLRQVGALLDARAFHPGRSAAENLRWLAATNHLPRRRVDEVLAIVGLTQVAGRRAGKFSLGMGQRLGIAAALLGDPGVLLFDEPVNGLDPEGIRWVRHLLRDLAADGRTVFVSSHLITEMSLTAQHLVVIGKGRMIDQTGVEEFIARSTPGGVRVLTPTPAPLLAAVLHAGGRADLTDDAVVVGGLPAARVGELAAAAGIVLHELTPIKASLEDAFMELTGDAVEYRSERRRRELATAGVATTAHHPTQRIDAKEAT